MATLTGNKPKDTYKGLIKTFDSNEVTGEVQLSDGNGNALPMTVSTTDVRVRGVGLTVCNTAFCNSLLPRSKSTKYLILAIFYFLFIN